MTEVYHPTLERIRHARERHMPPSQSQTEARPYHRILSGWDMMQIARGGREAILSPEQAMAGRTLTTYWGAVYEGRSAVCGYGESRHNGTPASQVQAHLLGPEWIETCRRKLLQSEIAVEDPADWKALIAVVSRDGIAQDAGRALGYVSRRHQMAKGAASLRRSLTALARLYGYLQHWPGRSPV